MRLHALSTIVLWLATYASIGQAIYQDEAFLLDYHHALLGRPQPHTTFFHRPSVASKASLLYSLSEKGILGAINPKDGTIVWRQRLGDHRPNAKESGTFLKAGQGGNTLISAANGRVSAWDAGDGRLVWGRECSGRIKGLELLELESGNKDALVLEEGDGVRSLVTRLDAGSGKTIWTHADESGDVSWAVSASSTEIFYVSLHSALLKGFKVRVTTLDIKTGKQTGQNTLSSDSEIVSEASILYVGAHTAAPVLVWTDKNLKNIKINILGTSHITSLGVSSHGNEEVGHIAVHGPRSANAQPHFLVHYQTAKSNWAQVYHVDASKRSVKRAYDLPSLGGKAAFSTSNIDSNVYFTRNSDFEVSLVSSASHGILERWPVRPKSHGGLVDPEGVEYAVSEVVSKDGSGFAVRSAATLSSGDWELIRNGDPVWTRPESLAGVVTAAWAELPKKHGLAEELAQESHSNLLTAYIHRVTRHINELRYFPSWIEGIPGRVITSFADPRVGQQNKNPQDDNFGLHKIVVVATEEGRLIALSTGNQGRIIWNINATYLPHGKRWDVLGIEVNKGVACVRAAGGEFLNVDVLAGKMLQRQASGSVPNLMTSISAVGMRGDTLRLALNMDGSPREIEVDRVGNTVVVTQRPDGAVLGWTSAKNAKPSIAWEFLPAFGETVSKVTTRPSHDPTASIGKALGDRNVLYKYLNPNLVIITAVNALTSTTSIYLLDSISGQTLYTTTHSDVDTSQSIPVVFSENWFAYSIFSDPSASALSSTQLPLPKSYQLIISELYESPLPNDRGPLGSASNFSSIHPTASPSTNTGTSMLTFPHVFSQAFVIPGHISHLSVTSTLQGITPRSILAVISSLNALISIPRGVIDPRRPINRDPTPAELEEGLFKYHPVLEFEPKWIVSHKRELMGLRKVITTPTMLESTSLVFAYGDVDVFGTRASPIGTFDLLGRGFSKAQLVVTVLALGTGTAVLGPMVRKKQINALWAS